MKYAQRLQLEVLEERTNLSAIAGAVTSQDSNLTNSAIVRAEMLSSRPRRIQLSIPQTKQLSTVKDKPRSSITLRSIGKAIAPAVSSQAHIAIPEALSKDASSTTSAPVTSTTISSVNLNATTSPSTTPATPPAKVILDSTNYTQKPANLALADGTAFTKVVVNGWWITQQVTLDSHGQLQSVTDENGVIQESGTRYLPHWAAAQGATYLVVDLEGSQRTVANCEQVLTWIREENVPNLKISFYSTPDAVGPNVNSDWTLQDLDQRNQQWKDFANKLDFLTPSLYCNPTMDQQSSVDLWKAALTWSVAECRKLAPGKLVLPFLCPRYVDYANFPAAIHWTMQPDSAWQQEVSTTLQVADGLVVWDPAANLDVPDGIYHPGNWSIAANSWWPALQKQ